MNPDRRKIEIALVDLGVSGYDLQWLNTQPSGPSHCWRFTIGVGRPLYGSTVRSMIRALRRRYPNFSQQLARKLPDAGT